MPAQSFSTSRCRSALVKAAAAAAALAATTSAVRAQSPAGFRIVIEGILHPGNPTVRVKVLAHFSPGDYAVAGTRFDLLCDDPSGIWSNPRNVPPLTVGSTPGIVSPPNVTGIVGGQLNFPAAGIFADPSNPITVWDADWSTTKFTSRAIRFETRTGRFDVYPDRNSPSSTSRLSGFREGVAEIIIPAPGAAMALWSAGILAVARRRR